MNAELAEHAEKTLRNFLCGFRGFCVVRDFTLNAKIAKPAKHLFERFFFAVLAAFAFM